MVNCTLYRSGASGVTTAGRAGKAGHAVGDPGALLGWSGGRQLADRRCDGQLRTRSRNDLFHVALALVPGRIEQLEMIVIRKHWREEANGGQREIAACQPSNDDGKAPDGARRFDPPIRRVFRQVQNMRAIRK
jgi:hypothetical protein